MRLASIVGEYVVKFRYHEVHRCMGGGECFQQRGTTCTITPPGEDVASYIAAVACDTRVPFVKFTGRKLAFAKALDLVLPGAVNRHLRAELWFLYLVSLGQKGAAKAVAGARSFERHAVRRGMPLGWLANWPSIAAKALIVCWMVGNVLVCRA